MEKLRYVIEDKTIAELLGVQNFSTDESAVLELVKNAYDAKASYVKLVFEGDVLKIIDDGIGMSFSDIKENWMYVGKSTKKYTTVIDNNDVRVLAGSKGIGRFALARLGCEVKVFSHKKGFDSIVWQTDWNTSTIRENNENGCLGTTIEISHLRAKWNRKRVENLVTFLSKTYNDNSMRIYVICPDFEVEVTSYFTNFIPGVNCLSTISLYYRSTNQTICVEVKSDEFLDSAQKYCNETNIRFHKQEINAFDELKSNNHWELSDEELLSDLNDLGDFSAQLSFYMKPSMVDSEKFLYKNVTLSNEKPEGVVLYRNAFSISSYEGKNDWLGLSKRVRKSPAAASHPTGAWRVRENQIYGKVEIDKQRNAVLQDLSNRQGLDENIYYELFVEIILSGIKEFERYRQNIIRKVNIKNDVKEEKTTPISSRIISNPTVVTNLNNEDSLQLATEIKAFQQSYIQAQREREDVEIKYKYDVRILNVLATIGLKASSIAHETRNDKNSINNSITNVIESLKEYGMWEELSAPQRTEKSYRNVPYLLDKIEQVSKKILVFMSTMLFEIEKKQFESSIKNINDIMSSIKDVWENDYAWISVNVNIKEYIEFSLSEDYLHVIFDNLILNSIQQNDDMNHVDITIDVSKSDGYLYFSYADNGKGLDRKYFKHPEKILEVHETTRKNGHGLGMWIINNTLTMTGGKVVNINGNNGFKIDFTLGEVR